MLVFARSVGFHGASSCIQSCFHYGNRYTSWIADHVFDEFPEGADIEFSGSFFKDSASETSARNRREGRRRTGYITETINIVDANEAALKSFRQSNASGTKPTRFLLCTALNSCAKTLNFHLGLQIHARLIRDGYEGNLFLSSALIDLYAKCGAVMDARRVFDGIKMHDQVSWTSMISGLSQNGHSREAILLFKVMLGTSIKPNCFTYVSVISSCTTQEESMLLHGHVTKLGLHTNSFIVSALVGCYSKSQRIDWAVLLFNEMEDRDNVLLNSMISGYSYNLLGEEAVRLFIRMKKENMNPTNHTLTSVLNVCGNLTVLQQGKQVHSLVTKMGCENNVFVASALIDMYSKNGSPDEACRVFYQIERKNSVLWTSMIMGFAQSGRGSEALELFEHLVAKEGYRPDHICFTALLTACIHAGFLDQGIEYFTKMTSEYSLVPQLDQYAILVDLYARNGHLRKAKEVMDEMPYEPNYVMWTSFLSSCRVYGEVELGREAANQLFKMEPENASSYITLASIYARAAMWAEVAEIRKLMQQKGVKKNAAGWSWIEVDNGVHLFSVSATSHPRSQEIYEELEKLRLETREAGFKPEQTLESSEDFC